MSRCPPKTSSRITKAGGSPLNIHFLHISSGPLVEAYSTHHQAQPHSPSLQNSKYQNISLYCPEIMDTITMSTKVEGDAVAILTCAEKSVKAFSTYNRDGLAVSIINNSNSLIAVQYASFEGRKMPSHSHTIRCCS